MKRIAASVLATVSVFLIGLSLSGYMFGEPGKPFFRIDPCYKGVQPVIAFGGTFDFNHATIEFGPKYGRFVIRAWSWPGGVIGFNTNTIGACPGTTDAEMDVLVKNRYAAYPELFDEDEPANEAASDNTEKKAD